MTYENELYHYGVLGMKWHTHNARRFGQKAQKMPKSSKARRRYEVAQAREELVTRNIAKAKVFQDSRSTGAKILTGLLGPGSNTTYAQSISIKKMSKAKAIGTTALMGLVSPMLKGAYNSSVSMTPDKKYLKKMNTIR